LHRRDGGNTYEARKKRDFCFLFLFSLTIKFRFSKNLVNTIWRVECHRAACFHCRLKIVLKSAFYLVTRRPEAILPSPMLLPSERPFKMDTSDFAQKHCFFFFHRITDIIPDYSLK
jgi:hypothetical protein